MAMIGNDMKADMFDGTGSKLGGLMDKASNMMHKGSSNSGGNQGGDSGNY